MLAAVVTHFQTPDETRACLRSLRASDRPVDRLVVVPMYPQYSATTTASATDVLFKALLQQRRVPALRTVPPYYEHPAYLDAMKRLINDQLQRLDKVVTLVPQITLRGALCQELRLLAGKINHNRSGKHLRRVNKHHDRLLIEQNGYVASVTHTGKQRLAVF